MKKILVGFDWFPAMEIDGEIYVRIKDVSKMATILIMDHVAEGIRSATNNLRFECRQESLSNYVLQVKENKNG